MAMLRTGLGLSIVVAVALAGLGILVLGLPGAVLFELSTPLILVFFGSNAMPCGSPNARRMGRLSR